MAKHQHLRVLKRVDIHPRQLLARGPFGPQVAVDAGDDVVAPVEHRLLQGLRGVTRRSAQISLDRQVPAKEMALEVDDVRFAAMHQSYPMPGLGPHLKVQELLEVA